MQRTANFNPFPGLRPFETDEYDLFFGRADQSKELLGRLASMRFVAVVGTSGSGKSSLVRAGLVPLLWGGRLPQAGSQWRVALLRPGDNPIHSLAGALCAADVLGKTTDTAEEAVRDETLLEVRLRRSGLGLIEVVRLARVPEGQNLLIIVDQFEELFRFADTPGRQEDAAAFVKLLLEALRQSELPIYVVLTMRSDFIGDCARFRDLAETVAGGLYLIPRMTREQRRAAIEEPVRVANGSIARRLVTRVLNDAGDDPDQLPIMQHALMRTWDHWSAREHGEETLDLADYEAVGAMAHALSRHADEAYDALDGRGQEIARRMFQRLTAKGADQREVRRAANVKTLLEVTGASQEELAQVIGEFRKPGRSFLMPPENISLDQDPPIDISHESLIRRWDRLAKWVEEESEAAKMYQRLADTARLHALGRAGLWGDPDLSTSLAWKERVKPTPVWAQRYDLDFDQAMAFLEESKSARDAALRRQKREHRVVVGAVTATIISLAVLAGAAIWNWQEARSSATLAREANENLFKVAAIARTKLTQARGDHIDALGDLMNWAPPSWLGYLYRQRATARSEAGDLKGAQRDIDSAMEQEPDFLPALVSASNIYMLIGDADAAVSYASTFVNLNKADASASVNLVLALGMRRDYDAAVAVVDECLKRCRPPQESNEDVNAPDIEEITHHFKLSMKGTDVMVALSYLKAMLYAMAGDKRFADALSAADQSDSDYPRSIDAYLGALNWQWMILRGQALGQSDAEDAKSDSTSGGFLDYGAHAMRGAMWARIAALRPQYEKWAQKSFASFRSAYEKNPQERYAALAQWMNAAPTRIGAPERAATSRILLDELREMELQADDLAPGSSSDPLDYAAAFVKLTQAIDTLRAADRETPSRRNRDFLARLLLKRASWRLNAHDRTGAAQDAREAGTLAPRSAEAHRLLAAALFDRDQRIAEYRKALELDSFNSTALRELSELLESDNPVEALELLRRRQLLASRSSNDFESIARIQAKQGQFDEALASIRSGLAIHPWRVDLLNQRRAIEIKKGIDEKIADLHLAQGLRRMADYYTRTGQYGTAMNLYVRAFSKIAATSIPGEESRVETETVVRNLTGFLESRYGAQDALQFWSAMAESQVASANARALAAAEYQRIRAQ